MGTGTVGPGSLWLSATPIAIRAAAPARKYLCSRLNGNNIRIPPQRVDCGGNPSGKFLTIFRVISYLLWGVESIGSVIEVGSTLGLLSKFTMPGTSGL